MYKPNQGNRPGGWKGGNKFGQKKPWERGFNDRDGARPTLYEATCSECGNACQVPFRPSAGRDVFCSNCFKKDGDLGPRKFGGPDSRMDSRRFSPDEKRMFKAVCDKCKAECEVPFRPNGSKPVYCRPCLTGASAPAGRTADQYADQFKTLNAKLDAILKALHPTAAPAAMEQTVPAKEKKAAKTAVKAKSAAKKGKKKA